MSDTTFTKTSLPIEIHIKFPLSTKFWLGKRTNECFYNSPGQLCSVLGNLAWSELQDADTKRRYTDPTR